MARQPGQSVSEQAKKGAGRPHESFFGAKTPARRGRSGLAEFLEQRRIIGDRRRRIALARQERTVE
jgi:hypothetical protein